jgi:hypothetical protein
MDLYNFCASNRQARRAMIRACALAGLVAVLPGCTRHAAAWKGTVEWPEDEQSVKTVLPSTEAGATLAAAAAIREMVRTNTEPRVFWGCASPEQGLNVDVFTGPTPGLYYVVLDQRFDRCGGPSGRVLDWRYVYAVTPQGEVIAEAPPPPAEAPAASPPHSNPPLPEQTPPSIAPSPAPGADTPAPTPSTEPASPPGPAASPLPPPSPPAAPSPNTSANEEKAHAPSGRER